MKTRPIKILTLNTHKGFGVFNRRFVLQELRDAVRATEADLVFLQEVLGEHASYAEHPKFRDYWPPQPQYEYLADSIWHSHTYGRNAVYPDGHHGNALLSHFPVTRWHNHDISLSGIERRGLLHCELSVQGASRTLHAICVHLSLREGDRQKQLRMLLKLVDTLPAAEPIIVAGDFNDWRLKAQPVMEAAGFRDLITTECGQPARTFPAVMPILRLDRMYIRGALAAKSLALSDAPWSRLSDHIPLLAEVVV